MHRRVPWDVLLVGLAALLLYLRTLAPSVAWIFNDSLEYQWAGWVLGIAHPTGYPLYTLLLKLFTLLPLGEVAWRENLLSALCAAATVALVYRIVMHLTNGRTAALLSAAFLAISPAFWSQAIIAQVHALAALFVSAIVWWLVSVHAQKSRHATDWSRRAGWLALLAGLGLAHHRMIVLLGPALIVYALLQLPRTWVGVMASLRASPLFHPKPIALFLIPLSFYLSDSGAEIGSAELGMAG